MKKSSAIVVAFALAAVVACQKTEVGPWFDGSYEAALSEAATRGSLVFVEFYSDT